MTHELLFCLAASCLAGFVQGFSGFGSTLVAMPLLLAVMGLRAAVPLISLLSLVMNVVMAARLRGSIHRETMKLLLASTAVGLAAGAWIMDDAPDALIRGLLGASILFLVADTLLRPGNVRPPARPWTAAAGFFSGAIGVCTGAAGPPVIAWAARQPWNRDELRANLCFFFLVSGAAIVGVQSLTGLITPHLLRLFVWSLPALAAGLWAGSACAGRLSEAAFRRAVLFLLGLLGVSLLWQALFQAAP